VALVALAIVLQLFMDFCVPFFRSETAPARFPHTSGASCVRRRKQAHIPHAVRASPVRLAPRAACARLRSLPIANAAASRRGARAGRADAHTAGDGAAEPRRAPVLPA
jgi:hypothetical protein